LDSPYTYTKEEDADGIGYSFYNETSTYAVQLVNEMYEGYLDAYPTLLKEGYELSVFSKEYVDDKLAIKDPNVSQTIFKIIEDHIRIKGKKTVLLYQCDTKDNREQIRHRMFEIWYKNSTFNDTIIKESVEVQIPQPDGTFKVNYIGFMTSIDNPDIEQVKQEFSSFCYVIPTLKQNRVE